MYYESKIKSVIQERWVEEFRTKNPHHAGLIPVPGMKFRNKQMKELFEDETPEIKAEVESKREMMDFDAEEDGDDEEEADGPSPEKEQKRKVLEIQRSASLFFPSVVPH